MTRIILRGLLGGLLGILMGENAFAVDLLSNPAFFGILLWYIFMFLSLDFAITKYQLRDKQLFFLSVILGILIGGILDNEFLVQGSLVSFLGVAIDIAIMKLHG